MQFESQLTFEFSFDKLHMICRWLIVCDQWMKGVVDVWIAFVYILII